ncbi:MAG: SRPBCC domain-containing protein, partial [Spirochaetaceae bacterium]|nr:SRPBCC domain-containing protein [Spirochaetaceae bacterium]
MSVRREVSEMHLQGEHTFTARQRHVWELLNDSGVLARITPGLSELEADGEDSYRARFAIKMGPINSTFSGT